MLCQVMRRDINWMLELFYNFSNKQHTAHYDATNDPKHLSHNAANLQSVFKIFWNSFKK